MIPISQEFITDSIGKDKGEGNTCKKIPAEKSLLTLPKKYDLIQTLGSPQRHVL
jgi:hypothetical protein